MDSDTPLKELAQALYTVNRHAKTAPEPQHLYYIKKETIHKLLKENRAKKTRSAFFRSSKIQQSTFYFTCAGG